MILNQEVKALEKDVLDFYEDLSLYTKRNPNGLPDKFFNHKVTARIRELLEVAQNMERASFNRDMSS